MHNSDTLSDSFYSSFLSFIRLQLQRLIGKVHFVYHSSL